MTRRKVLEVKIKGQWYPAAYCDFTIPNVNKQDLLNGYWPHLKFKASTWDHGLHSEKHYPVRRTDWAIRNPQLAEEMKALDESVSVDEGLTDQG